MKKRQPSSVTVHCWWPNWNIVAAGLILAGVVPMLGAFLSILWPPNSMILSDCAALFGLCYWYMYCRIVVTPWEIRVVSSGFLKGRYRSPLEEVVIDSAWALDKQAGWVKPADAGIYIGQEEDWDTGTPYLELLIYGEDIPNFFRAQHYPAIREAVAAMVAQRQTLEAATIEYKNDV